MSNEYSAYLGIQNAYEIALAFSLTLTWHTDGWSISSKHVTAVGTTVAELHQYLNGYRDGILKGKKKQ